MELLNEHASMNASMDSPAVSAWAKLGLVKVITAGASVPLWEYAALAAIFTAILFYHYMDLALLKSWFGGDTLKLVYDFNSPVAKEVLQKLKFDRFWPTPWLCSAHLQTTYLHFFAVSPSVSYRRELLVTSDGGTLGIDWVEPLSNETGVAPASPREVDTCPVVLIVPGLTSDQKSKYILHTAHGVVKKGWRAVVINHRGLGGVPLTSQKFYNAGWTQDLRFVVDHVRKVYPAANLLALGTSLGANILVKYLGEEGAKTPIQAAAAVGCPWDLVVVDRWMRRNSKQRLYGKGLTFGLKEFIMVHKESFAKLVDMDHVRKSRSVREFDDRITRIIGNFETVDTYYRQCSSAQFLSGVAIPLLGISAMDDPICTSEAIPWDECRSNPNLLLGVTAHGGHLAYLEGLFARRIWWVKQVTNFLQVVLESPSLLERKQAEDAPAPVSPPPSSIDAAPLIQLSPEGTAAAPANVESQSAVAKKEEKHVFEPINEACANGEEEGEGSGGDDSPGQSEIKTQTEPTKNPISEDEEESSLTGQAAMEGGKEGGILKKFQDRHHGVYPEGARLVVNLRSQAELQALESALSQLLCVVRAKSQASKPDKIETPVSIPVEVADGGVPSSSASDMATATSAIASAAASVLKSSAILMAMVSSLKRDKGGDFGAATGGSQSTSGGRAMREDERPVLAELTQLSRRVVDPSELMEKLSRDEKLAQLAAVFSRGLVKMEAHNKTSTWLMAYVALAATCPLVGTALLFRMYMQNGGSSLRKGLASVLQ